MGQRVYWIRYCTTMLFLIRSYYSDVIMGAIASQITSVSIVYSTFCPGADQRKHQSSVSLALVRGIHRWPVNSPHKGPVTRKIVPFDDVIMSFFKNIPSRHLITRPRERNLGCYFASKIWFDNFIQGPKMIQSMGSANESRRYNVTSSLAGWAHTQNDHPGANLPIIWTQPGLMFAIWFSRC